jgi:SAM-dependent methyltransferase
MKQNATNTDALATRISNQKNQSIDLNEWIFRLLEVEETDKVLELCCGTGAQTAFFAQRLSSGNLTCVDINQNSLSENRRRVGNPSINYLCLELDSLPGALEGPFDLIFCAYGFYYSRDPSRLLDSLMKHLSKNGRFVFVGPVLGNNSELYSIIRKIGCKISAEVLYSSEAFMLDFCRLFLERFGAVKFERILNAVRFDDKQALLDYWRNTTFYTEGHDKEFYAECESVFRGGPVVINKSIGFLQGRL